MRMRSKVLVAMCGATLVATTAAAANAAQPSPPAPPDAMVDGIARDLHITQHQARTRLVQQDEGSVDAIVGDAVCHSGNTAPNLECGTVNSVNQTVDYGNVIIDGLSLTTACSQGGDSGGAWLRGDKATGLHSGGESFCNPGAGNDNSIFQPVNEALTK